MDIEKEKEKEKEEKKGTQHAEKVAPSLAK